MPGKRHPVERKEQAIYLGAGSTPAYAGRELGICDETVRRWLRDADPAVLRAYVAEKQARAAAIIASRYEEGIVRVQDAIRDATTLEEAKMAQALATANGINGTKLHELTGSGQGGMGGRFGESDSARNDPRLRAIADRLLLGHLERLEPERIIDLEPDPPTI